MKRNDLDDLAAFAIIAAERSFTRAAVRLDMSPSALSHAMRGLEQRLGTRLLARTTRSVSTTEAGERLLLSLRPALSAIDAALGALKETRDKPAGTVRVTAVKHAAATVLMPMLPAFMDRYPNVRIEIDIDDGLTDIVADRFDAGIRFGGTIDRDMIAVRVGPHLTASLVASPGYFADRAMPRTPQDLAAHRCIVHRMSGVDGVYPWKFEGDGRTFQVRVEGAFVSNDSDVNLAAALSGRGIAYLFEDQTAPYRHAGTLVDALPGWHLTLPGYELYYPSRRQNPAALVALIDALRQAYR